MFAENHKISGRQTFRLLTYDLLGLGTLMIPPFLAKDAGTDGVFCIFLGMVAGVLYLKMLGVVLGDIMAVIRPIWKKKWEPFLANW